MMLFLSVFEKTLKTTYKTNIFSKGTFLMLLFGVFVVVLPFIFAYKSKGFWLKRDVFYEQPDVRFKGEFLFMGTINNNNAKPIICSTVSSYATKMASLESCPKTKVREIDNNFDGKIDELEVLFKVNLPRTSHITSLSIIIPLDYKLHTVCLLQMESAIIFQQFLPVILSDFYIVADLGLTQSTPLPLCQTGRVNSVYNSSIFKEFYEIEDVITQYSQRNVSTKLTNIYKSFTTGFSNNTFDLNIRMKIPELRHHYKPGFWQTLKWAWIQYLSIYFIVAWIFDKIKTYIFSRKLVLFHEDNPIKKLH